MSRLLNHVSCHNVATFDIRYLPNETEIISTIFVRSCLWYLVLLENYKSLITIYRLNKNLLHKHFVHSVTYDIKTIFLVLTFYCKYNISYNWLLRSWDHHWRKHFLSIQKLQWFSGNRLISFNKSHLWLMLLSTYVSLLTITSSQGLIYCLMIMVYLEFSLTLSFHNFGVFDYLNLQVLVWADQYQGIISIFNIISGYIYLFILITLFYR